MNSDAKRTCRLVAVVVTHNRLDHLKFTVERLLSSPRDVVEGVVVVNNHSTDGTKIWLDSQREQRLLILHSSINLGGAGGFEYGMREAMARFNPDWLIVMDDDAYPQYGALERFCAEDRQEYAVWAAAVYHPDGRICDINRPTLNPFWHRSAFLRIAAGAGRNGYHLTKSSYEGNERKEVDAASFVGLFVSSRAISKVGYPDGSLFIYGDDVLYTLAVRLSGEKIVFDPCLRFDHDFSTLRSDDQCFRPLWKCYYHHRNLLLVYRVAAGRWFWPALLVVIPKWFCKVRFYRGQKRNFLRLMVRALRDGLRGKTNIPHDLVVSWLSAR